MKKLFLLGVIWSLALCAGARAQTNTTTTNQGDANTSITGSATGTRQTDTPRTTQQQPRPTPSPVSPVRPLSQEDIRRQQAASERRRQEAASGDPDVLLDVPNLSVDEITLKVKNLHAHVSLDARLANLLQLGAGADASIDDVDLTIKGVRAEVLLKVRLDNVAAIIDRTLTTVDRNPQILERLLQSVDNTVWRCSGSGRRFRPCGLRRRLVAAPCWRRRRPCPRCCQRSARAVRGFADCGQWL